MRFFALLAATALVAGCALDSAQERLSSWAKSSGASLSSAGFLDYTQPRMVCMACSCPRGDIAIVFPENASAANKLENLGRARVEN